MNEIERINEVLNQYDLKPIAITRTGRVFKIMTKAGNFALKQIPIENERNFLEAESVLRSHAFPSLPVLSTKIGEPLVRAQNQFYYLTYWVESDLRNDGQKWEALIDSLAWLHLRTVRPLRNQGEAFHQYILEDWGARRTFVESFIHQAEHNPYPSPFEQRILLLFNRISSDAEKSINLSKSSGKIESPAGRRVSYCHGKPQLDHILRFEKGAYLINFDHAHWDSPVSDMITIFKSQEMAPEWMERFYDQYQTVFQLRFEEKSSLLTEILYPEPFENLMKEYRQKSGRSELDFLEKLHDLCERRARLQPFFSHLEKEISDEASAISDPSLEEADVEGNEQNEDDNIKRRGPKNGANHLKNGKG